MFGLNAINSAHFNIHTRGRSPSWNVWENPASRCRSDYSPTEPPGSRPITGKTPSRPSWRRTNNQGRRKNLGANQRWSTSINPHPKTQVSPQVILQIIRTITGQNGQLGPLLGMQGSVHSFNIIDIYVYINLLNFFCRLYNCIILCNILQSGGRVEVGKSAS